MKRLSPLVPGPPAPSTPCGRASTMWMTLSLRSLSPEVMKRLTPEMFQEPSSFGVANVLPAPTSEPASGSVSTMVAPHSRSTMSSAIRRSRSVPCSNTTLEKNGPQPYIQIGALAPRMNSAVDHTSECGAAVPPISAGAWRLQKPASIQASYDFLKAAGTGAVLVVGSKTGGVQSDSTN